MDVFLKDLFLFKSFFFRLKVFFLIEKTFKRNHPFIYVSWNRIYNYRDDV